MPKQSKNVFSTAGGGPWIESLLRPLAVVEGSNNVGVVVAPGVGHSKTRTINRLGQILHNSREDIQSRGEG